MTLTNKYKKALDRRTNRIATFMKWVEAIQEDKGRTDGEVMDLLAFHFDYLMNNLIQDSEEVL